MIPTKLSKMIPIYHMDLGKPWFGRRAFDYGLLGIMFLKQKVNYIMTRLLTIADMSMPSGKKDYL